MIRPPSPDYLWFAKEIYKVVCDKDKFQWPDLIVSHLSRLRAPPEMHEDIRQYLRGMLTRIVCQRRAKQLRGLT